MKPSTSSSKAGNSSKSKKNSKDREKRKSQTASEPTNQQSSEKGSPNKDSNLRKFAGYGLEELTIIAEQSVNEHLTDEVAVAFTEDINYKLRHMIYEAIVKARLSGRNYIASSDIEDTFESLQIEKVYGAESEPVWIPFSDQNLYYLDDTKINLIDIAEEPLVLVQPDEPILTRKWLPETKEVNGHLKRYFMVMCEAIVDKDEKIYQMALKDIKTNSRIGPIVEWFYHFGYFLLSKDITYDSLTVRALNLIKALEYNPVSAFIISDKQIMLLTRLLLQRLLRFVCNSDLIRPMCQTLAILCKRVPARIVILRKMIGKFPEVCDVFPLPIICAVNYLGLDAFGAILVPHIKGLFAAVQTQTEPDFALELLRSYNIICIEGQNTNEFCDEFFELFGESIIPYWKYPRVLGPEPESKPEYFVYAKGQMFKSRKKIPPRERHVKKIHIEEAFPENEEDGVKIEKMDDFDEKVAEISLKPSIKFVFHSCAPAIGRLRFLKMCNPPPLQNIETQVIVGKRTLLSPILKTFKKSSSCNSHTLMYHTL